METGNDKLKVAVSSIKVIGKVEKRDGSFGTWDGNPHVSGKTKRIHDYVLDEGQKHALKEAAGFCPVSLVVLGISHPWV